MVDIQNKKICGNQNLISDSTYESENILIKNEDKLEKFSIDSDCDDQLRPPSPETSDITDDSKLILISDDSSSFNGNFKPVLLVPQIVRKKKSPFLLILDIVLILLGLTISAWFLYLSVRQQFHVLHVFSIACGFILVASASLTIHARYRYKGSLDSRRRMYRQRLVFILALVCDSVVLIVAGGRLLIVFTYFFNDISLKGNRKLMHFIIDIITSVFLILLIGFHFNKLIPKVRNRR